MSASEVDDRCEPTLTGDVTDPSAELEALRRALDILKKLKARGRPSLTN